MFVNWEVSVPGETWRKLSTALGAFATGCFLILWVAIWPLWSLYHHYAIEREIARRSR
jgi:hypothetical protein